MNFRQIARDAVKRARHQMAEAEPQALKYAALELRFAMEALTYERAQTFKKEFPESEYATWQPRQVMRVLLEIDPLADKGVEVRYAPEDANGEQDGPMRSMGTETVLGLKQLKKHYDAIGSFLHVPTLKQHSQGHDNSSEALRRRCSDIADYLDLVLKSKIYNVNFSDHLDCPCAECGAVIRKRIFQNVDRMETDCLTERCPASYAIEKVGDKWAWQAKQSRLVCAKDGCIGAIILWDRRIEVGKEWTCEQCGQKHRFHIGFHPIGDPAQT